MHFVCPLPPKCRISKMFSFSWELKWPQERTMLMQNFGGTNKEHYGLLWFWSGQLHSRVWLDWMSVFFFFYQTVFFRGGTGENGFREWHNRGKHSINQVKLRGFAHVALTIIRCLLTFCFFALFFNFTLFFIRLLAVFQARMRTSLSHNLHKIQEFTLFYMLLIILKNCNVLMRIHYKAWRVKNKTL